MSGDAVGGRSIADGSRDVVGVVVVSPALFVALCFAVTDAWDARER